MNYCYRIPVIDIEQPVDGQVQAERYVDEGGVLRCEKLVDTSQHSHHVCYVQQLVVLRTQTVAVKCFNGSAQAQQVN